MLYVFDIECLKSVVLSAAFPKATYYLVTDLVQPRQVMESCDQSVVDDGKRSRCKESV